MVGGGGLLELRGQEPYSLEAPTTLSGTLDDQTGAISGGAFSTPTVSFEMDITDPITATVFIDAVFSTAAPATGLVDFEGNLVVSASVTVDIHVEVGRPALIVADCRSTPVNLTLVSTTPYDPDTGRVSVADANFTVPEVPTGGTCSSIVGDAVNDLLAGAGHGLSLTLQGEVPLPPPAGEPTVTTLIADPAGSSRIGNPFTLTAEVAPGEDAEVTGVPAGFVDFLAGSRPIGTAELDDAGVAELVVADLPVGTHELRARYRGEDPYRGSTSSPVTHAVTATPLLAVDLPAHVVYGADPVEFDLTVANTGLGVDLGNAQVTITIARGVRPGANTPGTGVFAPERVSLERLVDGNWETVTLTQPATRVVRGVLGEGTGFALPAGTDRVERLRMAFPDGGQTPHPTQCTAARPTCPGLFTMTIDLLTVDANTGEDDEILARTTGSITMVERVRRPTAIGTTTLFPTQGPFGTLPHTLRQGQTLVFSGQIVDPGGNPSIALSLAGVTPGGLVEMLIDGVRVPIRNHNMPLADGYRPQIPRGHTAQFWVQALLPPDAPLGIRQVTVRYLGDDVFAPSQVTRQVMVLPARGAAYECATQAANIGNFRFGANAVTSARLPDLHPGGDLDLSGLDIALQSSRPPPGQFESSLPGIVEGVNEVGGPGLGVEAITFALGPTGTGDAAVLTRTNRLSQPLEPFPAVEAQVDHTLDFGGETGTVTLDGAPGETVAVTLEAITIQVRTTIPTVGSATLHTECLPVGDPAVLGEVTLTGLDLSVSPGAGPVRAGDEVRLTATAAPAMAGTVEFRDHGVTIGVVPVGPTGVAALTTTLSQGARSLDARFFASVAMPALTSSPVAFTVLPAHDCGAFAQAGNGAVVRLVYLELLRRCPDQVGFDHWVDRLDSGTSPETFARSIARTPEAVGVVVNDGYQTMLGRNADAAGRTFWIGQLQAHGRYDRLLADLAASPEFWNLSGGTNEGFVTRVYDRLLHRAPDQAGETYWTGRLAAGTSPRTLVLTLANLDEPLGVLVVRSYDEILARSPNAAERNTGITLLRSTGDRSGLYAQLIGTPEFTNRAQSFPNPT